MAVKGPDTPLQFERESISLAIPENCVTNGWKITPLNAPEVRAKSIFFRTILYLLLQINVFRSAKS